MYNGKLLMSFINETFWNKTIERLLNVGITNMLNGSFVSFDEASTEE